MCEGEPRPFRSYRIVEEIRLIQVPQVQEAGSREQPVGRERFQDGVHRAGFQGTPSGCASLTPGRRRSPAPGCGWARAGGPGGRSRRAPGEERWGWRGSGALGGLRAVAPKAPWAFSRLLLLLLPGRSRLPWGARGWGRCWRSPPGRVGAGGGGAQCSPEDGWLPSRRDLSGSLPPRGFCHFPESETGNLGLVSPAGLGATPPHQYSRYLNINE